MATSGPQLSIIPAVTAVGNSLADAITQLNDALESVSGFPYSPALVLQGSGDTFTVTLSSEGGAGLLLDPSVVVSLSVVLVSGTGSSLPLALSDLASQLSELSGVPLAPVTVATQQGNTFTVDVVTSGGAGLLLAQSS
jgi:hypothetical protein